MNDVRENRNSTTEPQADDPDQTGSEKHIQFGGHEGPGVNIPGGLREPRPSTQEVPRGQYIEGYGTTEGQAGQAESEFVGSDKHIEFGGHQGPGVDIPGGLREPAKGEPDSSK